MRSLILSIIFLSPLSLFARGHNVIHFSGSIVALPMKAARRCIKEAAEHNRAQVCSGEDEQATTVTSDVHDYRSQKDNSLRREITLTYK